MIPGSPKSLLCFGRQGGADYSWDAAGKETSLKFWWLLGEEEWGLEAEGSVYGGRDLSRCSYIQKKAGPY